MKRILSTISLIVFSLHVSALDFIGIQQFPEWFQKSMLFEKKIKNRSKLIVNELGVNKKVKGKISLAESGEGYQYYTIDINTDSPAECYIFSEYDGTANSLYKALDSSIQGAAELNEKPLTGKFTYGINSGVIGSTPYLSLDVLYHLGQGPDKLSGLMKGYSAKVGDTLQICIHNEIGYRKTFFSAFESFVKAIASANNRDTFFKIVYQMNISGVPGGIAIESYTKDQDGDIEIISESALLFPAGVSSITSSDSLSTSWSSTDGKLINTRSYNIENGAFSYFFDLVYEDDSWVVKGEAQGKEQTYKLAYKGALTSNYGNYLKIAELLKYDDDELNISMWVPDADPSSVLDIKMEKIDNNSEANVKFDMGVMIMMGLVNEKGVASKIKILQGPVEMLFNTIYVSGAPQ